MVGLVVPFRTRRSVGAGPRVPLVADDLPRDVTRLDDGR